MIVKFIYALGLLGAFLTGASECLKNAWDRITQFDNEVQHEIQTNCDK